MGIWETTLGHEVTPRLANKYEKMHSASVREKASSGTKRKTRILVVDDYPVVRKGLRQLINREPDLFVCGEAGSVEAAVKAVKDQRVDLVLVDMILDNTTGAQLVKEIKAVCPNILALVFSASDSLAYVRQAIESGARGYITKDELADDIVTAIRHVLNGYLYISPRLLRDLPKEELDRWGAKTGSG